MFYNCWLLWRHFFWQVSSRTRAAAKIKTDCLYGNRELTVCLFYCPRSSRRICSFCVAHSLRRYLCCYSNCYATHHSRSLKQQCRNLMLRQRRTAFSSSTVIPLLKLSCLGCHSWLSCNNWSWLDIWNFVPRQWLWQNYCFLLFSVNDTDGSQRLILDGNDPSQ